MTSVNPIKWKASNEFGLYSFEVTVDDNSKDSLAVDEVFQTTIKQ